MKILFILCKCTSKQLPNFAQNIEKLKQKGIDEIVCISVNDIFTLAAFAKHTGTLENINFLADGNAEFARKVHLFEDLTDKDLGYRMKRSAMVVENGEIKYIGVDPSGEKESSADAVLDFLDKNN